MCPPLLPHLSKLCHNNNEPQLRAIQSGYWAGLGNLKIHFYGIGLILVPCTPAQRRLNTAIDGFRSRDAFTCYYYLRVKILVSSSDNREQNLWEGELGWEVRSTITMAYQTGEFVFFQKTNLTCLLSSSVCRCHVLSMYWLQWFQDMDWLCGEEVFLNVNSTWKQGWQKGSIHICNL